MVSKIKCISFKKLHTNMNLDNPYNTKLTPENVTDYVGREILFTYKGSIVKRTLLKVSECRKTIYVDHPETKNFLQLGGRRVVIIVVDDELAAAALEIPVLKRESVQKIIFPLAHNGEVIRGDAIYSETNKKDNGWPQDEEEDGETYFMCTGKCNRVCHYEDTNDVGMCGKCQFHLSISVKRKSKLATK